MRPIAKLIPVFALMFLSTILITQVVQADSIQSLPNLSTVTFLERTGSIGSEDIKTFSYNSTELTTRRSDPLAYSASLLNYDFTGALYGTNSGNYSECYDVFYSDSSGNFNINGEYITIEAVWPRYQGYFPDTGTVGGGLNIAAVYLTFADSSKVYADITASYVAFGNNKVVESYGWATDGSEETTTTMGNTIQPDHPDRLRITVGFSSPEPPPSGVPEPGTIILMLIGFAGLFGYGRRNLKE